MRRLLWQVGAVKLCLTLAWPVHPQSNPAQDYKAQVVKDVGYAYDFSRHPAAHSILNPNSVLCCVGIAEDNVSWSAGFNNTRVDYENIGLRPDFSPAYDNGGVTWINDHSPACTYTGSWLYRHDPAVRDDYAADETYSNVAPNLVIGVNDKINRAALGGRYQTSFIERLWDPSYFSLRTITHMTD